MSNKAIIGKAYGSIPHLPGSKVGPGDYHIHEGQARILTEKTRDNKDIVIVQEKLDGSCCGVVRGECGILPVTRRGYAANTSPFTQHWYFAEWVMDNRVRFLGMLEPGERVMGEWLAQAHGTRYSLLRFEPFAPFDIFGVDNKRKTYEELFNRTDKQGFTTPSLLAFGKRAISVEKALELLGEKGHHGAIYPDKSEGCVWRLERNGKVEFLAKYVRPDKNIGCYLNKDESKLVWNYDCSRFNSNLQNKPFYSKTV